MLKSLKAWAKDAYYNIQYACNLSGVVFAFEQLTNDLRELDDLRPDHPCVLLWVDKMDDLSRTRVTAMPMPNEKPDFDSTIVELVAVMKRLCSDHKNTYVRNTHPDIQAVIAKLILLAGSRDITVFRGAHDEVQKLTNTPKHAFETDNQAINQQAEREHA